MKLQSSKVPKLKPNPLFKGLPKTLKDPSNFDTTEEKLATILKSDHVHKTASSYGKCAECQKRRVERQTMMKLLGFKNIMQYMEWKKIMTIIKNKKDFEIK